MIFNFIHFLLVISLFDHGNICHFNHLNILKYNVILIPVTNCDQVADLEKKFELMKNELNQLNKKVASKYFSC